MAGLVMPLCDYNPLKRSHLPTMFSNKAQNETNCGDDDDDDDSVSDNMTNENVLEKLFPNIEDFDAISPDKGIKSSQDGLSSRRIYSRQHFGMNDHKLPSSSSSFSSSLMEDGNVETTTISATAVKQSRSCVCFSQGHRLHLWIALIVYISLLNSCTVTSAPAVPQFRFPDTKQDAFVRELRDVHVSWPSRVDHLGLFLSHELHAKHESLRAKRSLPTDTKDQQSSSPDSPHENVIHYKIPIHPDQDVVVRIKPTKMLLSPSALLEKKWSLARNISDSVFETLSHHVDCHFHGEVVGVQESRVALSACQGLRGFLQVDETEYLIEPVKKIDKTPDGKHAHIVYKREALPASADFLKRKEHHGQHKRSACGVDEHFDKAMNEREDWERKRRSVNEPSASSPDAHRRKKRSISTEKHVETLVVVDKDMVEYYENEDIQTYVMTVMNMVSTLFYDASIGNAINIIIVRIMLLQDQDKDLKIIHHADKSLKSFCKWQKRINFRDDDHPNHHDVAVLMTRKNICSRMDSPCSTLGLAQVAGLCQPHRTCSINQDTGLSLAWTVAHELGHNFGMKHDTVHLGCVSNSRVQYVMSPHLTWNRTPTKWSECSRKSVTKFLDRNWGYCLDDPPGHHDFKYPNLPAGTMYDADHQCRLLYGEGAEQCNGIEELESICTTLWCRVNNKCSTKLQSAAIGTICGSDKWCFAGQCVDIGERPQAIDGQWGEWSGWTGCTRTCGAGVSLSERQCNHPPPSSGGKYCTGERKRYRICNTDSCAEDAPSFRKVQCEEFNSIPYKGSLYEWKQVSTSDTPCQLHCKPKKMYFSVLLKDIVTDGTPCVLGSRHMCISGRCRHIGCDWVIDSDAVEDQCGVCYGDGTTCKTIKQQYNETKKSGYVEATVIPMGARNIRVEEVAEATNFLALKSEKGEYYLNGHWFIQWSGDYEVAGTVIHYKRKGNRESFMAPGPLKEPLHIMLLMQSHNPGVSFEYTVPKENATDNRQPEFSWDVTGWSHCTVSCGGGTQRSSVVCREQEAGVVDDRYCDAATKPDDRLRDCNDHLCPARWWAGPWQHCSVTCGDKGHHRRTVICVRSLGADEQIALEDSNCANLEKPKEIGPCRHKEPCPTFGEWKAKEWSNCTRKCNGGVQFRKVVCVGGTRCDKEKPQTERPCNEQKCSQMFDGSLLDIQEGGVYKSSNEALLKHSDSTSSFPSFRMYNRGNSGDNTYMKHNSVEAEEDGEDDINNVVKKNHVVNGNSNSGRKNRHGHRRNNFPSVMEDKPTVKNSERNSKFHWQTLEWSECSSHCGSGVQTRKVHCTVAGSKDILSNSLCDATTQPESQRECTSSACLDWQIGDWGECSATCGYAMQSRQVFCTSPGRCDDSQKPKSYRVCQGLKPCLAWVFGDWSKCTQSCGTGSQERLVQCVNLTSNQIALGCSWDVRPENKQKCNDQACPKVDAELTVACESNEMSYNVCRMLKKVGLCHKQYVQTKCCRTCQNHKRQNPKKSRRARR